MLPRARVGRLIGYEGDHGHVYKIWMLETGEIKRSRDVTFWEDDFFGSTGREENPVPIPKGPAVHVQYGNEEKSQRHDRLLQLLEDNLETIFDFTDIDNTQGRVQTLSQKRQILL